MRSNRQAGTISSHRLSYDDAFLYCITSNENGYNDWQLPFEHESKNLSSILVWYEEDKDISKDTEHEFFAIPVRDIDD